MTAKELVAACKSFDSLGDTARVSLFTWFLHEFESQEHVMGRDVNRVFDAVHESRPSNTSVLLSNLARAKRAVKSNAGYRLVRSERARWSKEISARESAVQVDRALKELQGTFRSKEQEMFFDEVMRCIKHGANRSACVMAWNLTFDVVCGAIVDGFLVKFNAQIEYCFRKSPPGAIAKRTDFESWKEFDVLRVAARAGVLTKNQKSVCDERLKRRNMLAHPSSIVATQLQAEEFVLDVVNNVIKPLQGIGVSKPADD